ncbi:hypothetical protein AB0D33_10315 [Streptomyces sp. NPDC048404]|uniref:hypothetical protein n=1 Tax=unclassified Streptomyces TaxID=2593676 RepID=UPI003448A6AC
MTPWLRTLPTAGLLAAALLNGPCPLANAAPTGPGALAPPGPARFGDLSYTTSWVPSARAGASSAPPARGTGPAGSPTPSSPSGSPTPSGPSAGGTATPSPSTPGAGSPPPSPGRSNPPVPSAHGPTASDAAGPTASDPARPTPTADPSRAGSYAGEGRDRPGRTEPDGQGSQDPGSQDLQDTAPAADTGITEPSEASDPSGDNAAPVQQSVVGPGSTPGGDLDVLPLGSGLILIGLGLGMAFLGLRVRRG